MRKFISLFTVFFLPFWGLLGDQSLELSLEEALLYALEENLQIQAGRTGGALQASSGVILQINLETIPNTQIQIPPCVASSSVGTIIKLE